MCIRLRISLNQFGPVYGPVWRDQRMIRSYRVKNYTTQDSYWPWWNGVCLNPNGCWGSKNRYWTVLRTRTGQWVFRTQVSDLDTPTQLSKGRRQNRKARKFGTMSQLGLTPPPSAIWDIFEFGTFLKNVDPPPLTKLGHF